MGDYTRGLHSFTWAKLSQGQTHEDKDSPKDLPIGSCIRRPFWEYVMALGLKARLF